MCEQTQITCSCCKTKVLKKYDYYVCLERSCNKILVSNYLSKECLKCRKNCLENVCSSTQRNFIIVFYTEKSILERVLHYLGIKYFFRYYNSTFDGLENYKLKNNSEYRRSVKMTYI